MLDYFELQILDCIDLHKNIYLVVQSTYYMFNENAIYVGKPGGMWLSHKAGSFDLAFSLLNYNSNLNCVVTIN